MTQRNYLNRPLAEGIRTIGFRKWYERELLSSHAHMLIALLCTIALMATMELFSGGSSFNDKVVNAGLFVISGALGLWALRRYLFLLSHAETVADQANCPHCKDYGRLTVVKENKPSGEALVKCRTCSHEWVIGP
ncbi:MAG: hypothetical protein V4731_09215 [Pseudomonadota bacterium]